MHLIYSFKGSPMIFIVFGLPGSGKSFFAEHFATEMNAKYISSDTLRKEIFDKRTYTAKEKEMVYDEMLLQTIKETQQNKNVVLDATFYKKAIRKKFIDELENFDEVIFIEVRAVESLIKERVQKVRENSEADFEVYKKMKTEWEALMEEHLILESTNDNIKEMLEKTSHYLNITNDKETN